MNFQQLKNNDQIVESALIDFCIRSKPYDFCSIKNHSVKLIQIKKYYEYLVDETSIFYLSHGDHIRFFLSIKQDSESVVIEFIFGDPLTMLDDFRIFREFYWRQFNCDIPFTTEIKRRHKLKPFLNFIKKKDRNAKFLLDNGKILVSYTRDGV